MYFRKVETMSWNTYFVYKFIFLFLINQIWCEEFEKSNTNNSIPVNFTQKELQHFKNFEDVNLNTVRRPKRFLDILETSRMFFRINCKINIIPKPTIWAHGLGFRVNIPIQFDKKFRPYKRDVYESMKDLMDRHEYDGKACALKAFCIANVFSNNNSYGFLFKLFKYIFALSHEEKRYFPYLQEEYCSQILHSHCPLSFSNISPFTDDV